MPFVIYKITQTLTQKSYIGYTNNFKRRWKEHKKSANNNSDLIFSRALRKYGFNTFDITFLEENIKSEYDAGQAEIKWIEKLNTNNKLNGYNMTPGGAKPPSTPESIEKMKKSLAITQNTEEYKKSQRQKMINYLDNTPESRDRLLQIRKDYYNDPENRKNHGNKMRDYFNLPGIKIKHSEKMKEASNKYPKKKKFSEKETIEIKKLYKERILRYKKLREKRLNKLIKKDQ